MPDPCHICGEQFYEGFARCPKCGQVRAEFEPFSAVINESHSCCVLSGADTDVWLPHGDWGAFVVAFVPVWCIGAVVFGGFAALHYGLFRFRVRTMLVVMTLIAGLLYLWTLRASE
jgi:hypothetical protein